jgi:hypothetical protein
MKTSQNRPDGKVENAERRLSHFPTGPSTTTNRKKTEQLKADRSLVKKSGHLDVLSTVVFNRAEFVIYLRGGHEREQMRRNLEWFQRWLASK